MQLDDGNSHLDKANYMRPTARVWDLENRDAWMKAWQMFTKMED